MDLEYTLSHTKRIRQRLLQIIVMYRLFCFFIVWILSIRPLRIRLIGNLDVIVAVLVCCSVKLLVNAVGFDL